MGLSMRWMGLSMRSGRDSQEENEGWMDGWMDITFQTLRPTRVTQVPHLRI